MAVIESLENGLKVLQHIAEAGAPLPTSALIENCRNLFGMSDASTRNTLETLVKHEWLTKSQSPVGRESLYGLGRKAARLWQIYVRGHVQDLKEKQQDLGRQIQKLEQTIEFGV